MHEEKIETMTSGKFKFCFKILYVLQRKLIESHAKLA